jgi:MoaA/NifB/PqqE/SkfB family radical SAM enzyme
MVENNVRVRIGCVIHSGNENNLRDIVSTCEDLGVDELVFSYMEPAGRVRPGDPSLPHRDDASILAQIAGVHAVKVRCNFPGRKNPPIGLCPGGERFLYIDNLGRLSPCSWIGKNPSFRTAASLKEIPLERLLTDESLLAYRSWLKAQAPGCPIVNGSLNS